jgi:S-adenosylmethionine:tRNA ribosyltransferase-isomerase
MITALEPGLEAHEPPEARGGRRDDVRLLVGRRASGEVSHHAFTDLPDLLEPGDLVVVNTSATEPAAFDVSPTLALHLSSPHPSGGYVVELRDRHRPYSGGAAGQVLALPGEGRATLLRPYSQRLWIADLQVGQSIVEYGRRYGHAIRYPYVDRDWPISYYQTVFADPARTTWQSAEMPSAGRPFTTDIITRLVSRGVAVAPVTLHTGVASPEAHEPPYPERYEVPAATARLVAATRSAGGRVIAVGTTVVRALETAGVRPARGWTSLVVTPARGVRVVDGLLTGLHEPRASHLSMLAAIVGTDLLDGCYAEAVRQRYRWHEFGDVNLLLP